MANLTHVEARNVHGTNPQYLIERIALHKIWEMRYWKEKLFATNSESMLEHAVDLISVGGTYGGSRKPTDFLCCLCKLLQLQPEKDIILEFISQDDFKYVRVLGAAYLRLVGNAIDVYHYLEPLLLDWRKIRLRQPDGKYIISHVDEIIDELLNQERVFDIILPRIPTRLQLEEQGKLAPRKSQLEDFDNFDIDLGLSDDEDDKNKKSRSKDRRRSSSRGRDRRKDRDRRRDRRGRDRDRRRDRRDRRRSKSRDRSRGRDRRRDRERRKDRSRSRSRDRDRRVKEEGGGRRVKEEGGGDMKRFEKKSLSVKETSKMRKQMGLAPLE